MNAVLRENAWYVINEIYADDKLKRRVFQAAKFSFGYESTMISHEEFNALFEEVKHRLDPKKILFDPQNFGHMGFEAYVSHAYDAAQIYMLTGVVSQAVTHPEAYTNGIIAWYKELLRVQPMDAVNVKYLTGLSYVQHYRAAYLLKSDFELISGMSLTQKQEDLFYKWRELIRQRLVEREF